MSQPRQRSEKRQRTHAVAVRLSSSERAELEELARALAGGSMSALLRDSALQRKKEALLLSA